MQAGVELAFTVFPKPAAFVEPGEGTFDHPAFGDDGEGMKFAAFGDFDRSADSVQDRRGEVIAAIAAINQQLANTRQIVWAGLEHDQGPGTVGDVGGGDMDSMGQAVGVHPDMRFDAADPLAAIIAFLLGRVGIAYALRVNNQEGSLLVSPKALAHFAHHIF